NVLGARPAQLQQVPAGRALPARGLDERALELTLHQSVDATDLLLFAKLQAVAGQALSGLLSMLSGRCIQLALGVERSTRAFQEKVGAFPSRQLAFGACVTSHCYPCAFKWPGCESGTVPRLDSTTLGRSAAIVRNRRH